MAEQDTAKAMKRGGLVSLVAAVSMGVILGPLNSTMVAVALSPIGDDLDVSTSWATWLIASYLLVMAVGQPVSGRIGDMYGRRRLFIVGLLYFGLASALALISWNFASLVFFRLHQAIGAAMLMPNGIAALRSLLPQESRGRAFGLLGAAAGLSAGIGPPLGGVLVDGIGWRALFAVNIPLVAIALALALRYLPSDPQMSRREPLDLPGALALGTGLVAMMIGAIALGHDGPAHPLFWASAFVFTLSVGLFVWLERRHSSPIILPAMFRRRAYTAGATAVFLSNMGMFVLIIAVPLFIQDLKGESPTRAGLVLLGLPLLAVVFAPISGALADRVGRNLPAVTGAILLTLGAVLVAAWDSNTGLLYMVLSLGLFGMGLGVMQTAVYTAAIEACPPSMAGAAAGTYATARYLGAIVAMGMVGAFLADGELDEVGIFRNLMIGVAIVAALTIVSAMNIHRWVEAPAKADEGVRQQVG